MKDGKYAKIVGETGCEDGKCAKMDVKDDKYGWMMT